MVDLQTSLCRGGGECYRVNILRSEVMCLGCSRRLLRLHCFTVLTYWFISETSLSTSTTDTTCDPAHYLLTYLLTPWSRDLLEKLTGSQLVKKFPTFYGTRRSITAFTSARHLSLSWASSIRSMPPHRTSWRSYQHTTHCSYPLHYNNTHSIITFHRYSVQISSVLPNENLSN